MRWLATFIVFASLACGGKSHSPTDTGGGGRPSDAGGGSGAAGMPEPTCEDPSTCFIGDQCHVSGASDVPAGDGCNTCSCSQGVKTCTSEPCDIAGAPCVVGARQYASGSLVPVDCNSCLCVDGELRSCTTRSCSGPGARCRVYQDCPVNEVCIAPACGAEGVCVPFIECPVLGPPACSCSGQTHPSACLAARSDFAIAHMGACEELPCLVAGESRPNGSIWDAGDGCNTCSCADGAVSCTSQSCVACTSTSGNACEADEYCAFPDLGCGSQGAGVCRLRPRGNCQIEAPGECGCDGNRYMNYCAAAAAGVSVGECADTP